MIMYKIKFKLITLFLFLKYVKKGMTFDAIVTLKKDCQIQAEAFLF